MATYVVGDIQGCYAQLEKLLKKINFSESNDTLWCTGDLVNRGPRSLDVLRFFKSLGSKHKVVLGNHDLHLLAVAYGARDLHHSDTLTPILCAADKEPLLDWLRHQPLLVNEQGYVMTHAGLAPAWSLSVAERCAKEVEAMLQSNLAGDFFKEMYGNMPDIWDENLIGMARLRCIVNYFTRMRFCYSDGRLELSYKGDVANKPESLVPWFDVKTRVNTQVKIIFGHWAALNGQVDVPNLYALDTGCVWGNRLTAMRLEDEMRFEVGAVAQA